MNKISTVSIDISSSWFDMLITVLDENSKSLSDEYPERSTRARELMNSLIKHSRIDTNSKNINHLDLCLNPSEVPDLLWHLIFAVSDYYEVSREYHKELKNKNE